MYEFIIIIIKKILLNANLNKINYNVIIYEIKIKNVFKNIKKKMKIFIKINKNI